MADKSSMRRLFPEPAKGVPPNQWTAEQWIRATLEDYTTRPEVWKFKTSELNLALEKLRAMLDNINTWKQGPFRYNGAGFRRSYYNNLPDKLAVGYGVRNIWHIALDRCRPDLLTRLRTLYPEAKSFERRSAPYPSTFTTVLDEIIAELEGENYRGLYDPTDRAYFGR